ncbi:MAG: DUF6125 family protein [Promethearchaeota archaeon]
MTLFDQLDKNQLKELLIKCWMTHDGAWFYNCYNELGIKAANKLNKLAIKNLSAIEVQRVKKAMGMENETISTFEQFKTFINNIFSVVKGDFMNFIYSFPQENCLHWEMNRCFAHEGMKRIGISDLYECGILYRVSCWLNILGIKHRISPKFKKCLLYSQEICFGEIIFDL